MTSISCTPTDPNHRSHLPYFPNLTTHPDLISPLLTPTSWAKTSHDVMTANRNVTIVLNALVVIMFPERLDPVMTPTSTMNPLLHRNSQLLPVADDPVLPPSVILHVTEKCLTTPLSPTPPTAYTPHLLCVNAVKLPTMKLPTAAAGTNNHYWTTLPHLPLMMQRFWMHTI